MEWWQPSEYSRFVWHASLLSVVLHYRVFSCHQTTVWPLQGTCLQFHHLYLSCLHFMLKTVGSKSGIFKECTEKSELSLPLKSSGIETDYIFGLFPKLECILFWRLYIYYCRGLRNKGLNSLLKYLSVTVVWYGTLYNTFWFHFSRTCVWMCCLRKPRMSLPCDTVPVQWCLQKTCWSLLSPDLTASRVYRPVLCSYWII